MKDLLATHRVGSMEELALSYLRQDATEVAR